MPVSWTKVNRGINKNSPELKKIKFSMNILLKISLFTVQAERIVPRDLEVPDPFSSSDKEAQMNTWL